MQGIQDLLSDFLGSIAGNEELSLVFLQELWPQIVGAELADESRPLQLRKGVLKIGVHNPLWKSELKNLQQLIVRAVNQMWKASLVERIRFEIHQVGDEV